MSRKNYKSKKAARRMKSSYTGDYREGDYSAVNVSPILPTTFYGAQAHEMNVRESMAREARFGHDKTTNTF